MTRDVTARVAIVDTVLLHYRLRFVELLHEELARSGIVLRVVHGSSPPTEEGAGYGAISSPWSVEIPTEIVSLGTMELVWHPVWSVVRHADLVVVPQMAVLLHNYVFLARQYLGGPSVALWGHGQRFEESSHERAGDALKRLMSRAAHWWFAYTEESADIVVRQHGYPRERITVVRNATDSRRLARLVDDVSHEEVRRFAHTLGVTGDHVGVFVGTFRRSKQLDFLVAAARHIREAVPDFELVLAGDGPIADDVRRWIEPYPWIHDAGPRLDRELARLLRLASVLLVPGWAGLVVVDSFAAGVPLVACRSFPHPPEISYLESGVNGLLVDDGGDPARYARAVRALLADPQRQARLADGCREARARYNAEEMATRFAEGVRRALRAR